MPGWYAANNCSAAEASQRYSSYIHLKGYFICSAEDETSHSPGYNNMHVQFVKKLHTIGNSWQSKFFSRIMATDYIVNISTKANMIALKKPGKYPSLAADYRPVLLLSVWQKLLECLALQRISPAVEGLLSPQRAAYQKGRTTYDKVAALTTFIKNVFQHNLKTAAVFLDLTAVYDTVWQTGLLYKLSKSMPYWFIWLVGVLLPDRRFRLHLGHDISCWRPKRNGLPQGCVLAPILFNL